MNRFLVLVLFLAVARECFSVLSEFTYITPPFQSTTEFSLRHYAKQRAITLRYRNQDGQQSATYSLQTRGDLPFIRCRRNSGKAGAIFYDGSQVFGVGTLTLNKRLAKRAVGVFYDPSLFGVLSEATERNMISILDLSTILHHNQSVSLDEIRTVDEAVQRLFGGLIEHPQCYVVVIDSAVPDTANTTMTCFNTFEARKSPIRAPVFGVPDHCRPVLSYMTAQPIKDPNFYAEYHPKKHSIKFKYEKGSNVYSTTLSLSRRNGQPSIVTKNSGRDGIIHFDRHYIQGIGFDCYRIAKSISYGRVATLLFNPAQFIFDGKQFRKEVGQVLFRWGIINHSSNEIKDETEFRKVDNLVQQIVAKYMPGGKPAFLIIFDSPLTSKVKESVLGFNEAHTYEFPMVAGPPYYQASSSTFKNPPTVVPNGRNLIQIASVNLGPESEMQLLVTPNQVVLLSKRDQETLARVDVDGSSVICRTEGNVRFLLFQPDMPVVDTRNVMGSTLHIVDSHSCAFALLWIEIDGLPPFSFVKKAMEEANFTIETSVEDMNAVLSRFLHGGNDRPMLLIKITPEN